MPSSPTAYVVFEEVQLPAPEQGELAEDYRARLGALRGRGAWVPIINDSDAQGYFEERDHKGAIDLALADRDAEARAGGFAAAPARNWREFDFSTKVDYVTQAAERNGHTPVVAPEPEPEPAGA